MDLRTQVKCEHVCVQEEESDKMREGRDGAAAVSGRKIGMEAMS